MLPLSNFLCGYSTYRDDVTVTRWNRFSASSAALSVMSEGNICCDWCSSDFGVNLPEALHLSHTHTTETPLWCASHQSSVQRWLLRGDVTDCGEDSIQTGAEGSLTSWKTVFLFSCLFREEDETEGLHCTVRLKLNASMVLYPLLLTPLVKGTYVVVSVLTGLNEALTPLNCLSLTWLHFSLSTGRFLKQKKENGEISCPFFRETKKVQPSWKDVQYFFTIWSVFVFYCCLSFQVS